MLIAGIAIGAFILVGSFAVWSRLGSHRAERRSVTTHQHALDVLGTASRRWEGVAPVHFPKADEVARAHVQPMGAPSARQRADDAPVPTHRPAVRLVPPSGATPLKLPISIDGGVAGPRARDGLVSGESGGDFADRPPDEIPGRQGATLFDHEALEPAGAARKSSRNRHRYRGGRPARRAASAAAAAVAVAAIGVASWQLMSGGTPGRHARAATSKTKSKTHAGAGGHSERLVPTSASSSVVAYLTPSRTYTINFSASGPCWLGVQQGVNGRYLWMATLTAGQEASYKASGPVAVRLGAPANIKVEVDAVSVELPAKNVQPYDITFSPSRRATGSPHQSLKRP